MEHSHALTADVKLTLDGKTCTATDLKPGTKIRVTLQSDEPHAAIRVEAIDRIQRLRASEEASQS